MSDNTRQQRLIERIQEDERLRGDLEGEAAKSLVAWASAKVEAAAADEARPDELVEAEVQTIRATARRIARSGEHDPQQVVALAEAALGEAATGAEANTAPAASQPVAEPPRFPLLINDTPDSPQAEMARVGVQASEFTADTPDPSQADTPAPMVLVPAPAPISHTERRSGWRLGERLRRWFR